MPNSFPVSSTPPETSKVVMRCATAFDGALSASERVARAGGGLGSSAMVQKSTKLLSIPAKAFLRCDKLLRVRRPKLDMSQLRSSLVGRLRQALQGCCLRKAHATERRSLLGVRTFSG